MKTHPFASRRLIFFVTRGGLVLLVVVAASGEARADTMRDHPRVERCLGYGWRESTAETVELVRCVAHSFDSPGSPLKAVDVARCESGFRWWLRGYHEGLFQHLRSRWLARWAKWGRPVAVPRSAYNALSAAVVSVRMARAERSWSRSWSCG